MLKQQKRKLLVIIGPTAVGKTKMSIELAKQFNGEIISGDSMQVYKGMDIGTAKIKREETEGIPHYLLDIKEPDEPFSAAEFQERANACIEDIQNRGKLPIIVGGTGLYIQSVIYDYQFSEAPSDPSYRGMLEKQVKELGIDPVFEQLQSVDPESANRIHPNNVRRVIRALEIFHCTGKTMSEQLDEQPTEMKYDTCIIGLTMDREKLYQRIDQRVDGMIEEGLIQEVQSFYEQGLRDCQSIQAIGYKEIYDFIDERASLEEAIEALKQNSRRYAKRQLTWFRNKMDVIWFDMTKLEDFSKKIHEISGFIAGKLFNKGEYINLERKEED
ncbi:tRNA (adenosine(37)-N6)-dimethylallyltransferase MiaA [Peribacillus butanolivorans]|uniref:tRNA dimethylallyltransferase n=1 Tax=Peribacillus butanolivorans TaxID=421767 RepID=A0AAX0RS66_9BACI|nr:tRNA (adenosine(37)-N6)-dimethylallyltransferase MiaA [Peribacillus butanolivorans]AXN40657.1 tRNA (adenosine(37)-N6)-dimethylallyltransferase MiaA [Peribacillus butanolivorans]PEJ34950.1 tRNA (adenosine(37)-N6)-dimethylallyltransferase MiaA [Peribacillus butanolivorans]QNU05458.1 tRNA (adenosine(37)-N6)-dimethylallyltransferase MiaA [Peribacillus butanolivorans]